MSPLVTVVNVGARYSTCQTLISWSQFHNSKRSLLLCSLFFDDWFFVVLVEPLEEHLVPSVLGARSSCPIMSCALLQATYTVVSMLHCCRQLTGYTVVSMLHCCLYVTPLSLCYTVVSLNRQKSRLGTYPDSMFSDLENAG